MIVYGDITKIEESNHDQKSLFDITTHERNFELTNRFGNFFDDKIGTLRTIVRIDPNTDVKIIIITLLIVVHIWYNHNTVVLMRY